MGRNAIPLPERKSRDTPKYFFSLEETFRHGEVVRVSRYRVKVVVNRDSLEKEVEAAYRRVVLQAHPDKI